MENNSQNFGLITANEFIKNFEKLTRRDSELKARIIKTLNQLTIDPYYPGLKTYHVNTRNYGKRYSSRVTGDLRIIWDFEDNKAVIYAFTIGGHSGGNKVYK